MKQQDSKIYQNWFKKGDDDLAVAMIIFKDGKFMDSAGYHLNQAIEKYLKGFLLFCSQSYPRTHNLVQLLRECSKFDQNIIDYSEECERMNIYYIEVKYPIDMPQDYPRDEMQKSIEMTEFLIKYIKKAVRGR